jgi:broad specificity phosphatase PhoE
MILDRITEARRHQESLCRNIFVSTRIVRIVE